MLFEFYANDVMFCGCDVPDGKLENHATTTFREKSDLSKFGPVVIYLVFSDYLRIVDHDTTHNSHLLPLCIKVSLCLKKKTEHIFLLQVQNTKKKQHNVNRV